MVFVKTYKVQLTSGRILGPLTLSQIASFIQQDQMQGTEMIRVSPERVWKEIKHVSEVSELFILKAQGKLTPSQALEEKGEKTTLLSPTSLESSLANLEEKTEMVLHKPTPQESHDPTVMNDEEEKTKILDPSLDLIKKAPPEEANQTMIMQNPLRLPSAKKTPKRTRTLLLALLVFSAGYFFLMDDPSDLEALEPLKPIRLSLPANLSGKSNPKKSEQLYAEGMNLYHQDVLLGYYKAAEKFKAAAEEDMSNIKALAMLACTYMDLIDSSNKDENYFSILTKLIDLSRAKSIDLLETALADIEFFIITHKLEAAKNRIIEYTKNHPHYGPEMFYYMGLVAYLQGEFTLAAKYMNQLQNENHLRAKNFYLRGLLAEKLQDFEAANLEYKKATQINPMHAKSYLRLAALANQQGKIKEASSSLAFLVHHPQLLISKDMGFAFYLNALFYEAQEKWPEALQSAEKATQLDPENHDYLLELYTLKTKGGNTLESIKKQARMYFFLGEGEKRIQEGKYQDAIVSLLQAREAYDQSPLPLLKMGDLFSYLNNLEEAKINYQLATKRGPKNVQIWSKYIQSLIQTYEWEEAKKAMIHFKQLSINQSVIEKTTADLYQKQDRRLEAQAFYKKAMAHEYIDPQVYIAYAKSLMSTHNHKDAPFFFSLALRFDPLNLDAIISTAKCIAETESVEKAIEMLQNEAKQRTGTRAEFLAAIAEFQMQKGAWNEAQINIQEAMKANPSYSYSWKLQAKIYLNEAIEKKGAIHQALSAYQVYSERNPSDPSGYLERYKIFSKKYQFDKAKEELNKIYSVLPKYPGLHYYMGILYAAQGNHIEAVRELQLELNQNTNHLQATLALGKEFLDLKNYDNALKYFSTAMRLAPENSEPKHYAGWTHYFLKNYQPAITLLRLAQTMDSANPLIAKHLGIVYQTMGDMLNACEAFKRYLEIEPEASDRNEYVTCF